MIESNARAFTTAVITTTGVDYEISDKFDLDRYAGDSLTLPYTFNEVRIKSNDLAVADNVNAALTKLYHNFLYINSKTKIADNNFPQNYKGFLASTSATSYSGVGWYPTVSASDDVAWQLGERSATTTILSGIVAGDFAKPPYAPGEYFGMVALSARMLGLCVAFSDQGAVLNLNKTNIEDASGLTFTNIRSVKFNSEYRVIVADDTSIHKLDVDPVLTSNRALSSIGQFLIRTIGGKSRDIYDKDKFNVPIDIAIGRDDTVYVLDQGDYGIKKYDSGLNWLQTSARKNQYTALSGGKVVSIAVDKTNDYVYVLSDNGIIFEYDQDLIHIQTITLEDPIGTTEKYKQLTFSNKDDNVIYVMTTNNLYKKFKSRLSRSIGAFRLEDNKITGETFAFCSLMLAEDHAYDYVFVGSNSTHASMTTDIGKIYKFDENISYKTLSNDLYKSDLLPLSAIKVRGSEYVTDFTINKALNKLMFNHLIFRDSFAMKYTAAYDNMGRVQLTSVDYLKDTDYNLFSYTIPQDLYVGINEPVFADNINKSFEKVYELQENLLKMCAENITNKFPFATQVIELK